MAITSGTDAIQSPYSIDVVSNFDLHKPEYLNTLFRRYGDQGMGYYLMLKALGWEKSVASDEYNHFEENWIHETFKTRNNVADPGAGFDVNITLSTDNVDANNNYYPRLYDQVMFANEVTGYVAAIDDSTPADPVLTIRPNKAASNIGALTAGDEIIIISSAFSEQSGQPEGAFSGAYKYTNELQIIKETLVSSGSEMAEQTWLQLNGVDGAPWYFKGQDDLDFRMQKKIDGALLFSTRTDNPNAVDAVTGNVIKTTEGLVPYIRRVGNEYTYTSGSFDVTNWDSIDRTLDQNFVGNYMLSMLGIVLHQDVENSLKTYFQDTNIVYAKETFNEVLFNGNDSLGASVNFKYLTKSERTYGFKRMKAFNDPKSFGATGYNVNKLGVLTPLNETPGTNGSGKLESIGCRYKALGSYERRMKLWKDGAAIARIGDVDVDKTYMLSHYGAHHKGGNRMMLITT